MEEIRLNGTWQQQAAQLWEMIKTRELSAEALKVIMPDAAAFYKELANCIDNTISSDKEVSITAINALAETLKQLSSALGDKDLSPEEKVAISNAISKLSDNIREICNKHQDNSAFSKNLLIVCTLFLTGTLAMLGSKKI